MLRRRSILALAALLACLGGTAPARADEAPTVTGVGWWTRSPAAGAPPTGGLTVGMAPDGPVSVAAVRLQAAGATTLELEIGEVGGLLPEAASILVCAGADDWVPVQGGSMADAPSPDCSTSVPLSRDDQGRWNVDLRPLVRDREAPVSLVLVPAGSGTVPGLNLAWEVQFAPPVLRGDGPPAAPPPPVEDAPVSEAAKAGPFAALETTPMGAVPPVFSAPVASDALAVPAPVIAGVPTPIAVTPEPGTRWTLLLPLALVAALLGALGGGLRWALLQGPLAGAMATLRRA